MDILVICSDISERVQQFQQFVRAQGRQVVRIAPGNRTPATELPLLGCIYFEQGETNLPELVRAIREQLRYLGIPLFVVSSHVASAGADLIGCSVETPDAVIFKQMISVCPVQAVTPDLAEQLAAPLTTAVQQALSDMTGVEFVVRSMYKRDAPAALGDISALLEISTTLEGAMIFSCSTNVAEAFAQKILADVAAELRPALTLDCVGEIANIVAGQAKALLAGTPFHFSFSSPRILSGNQELKLRPNMDSLVIAFDSELGSCALQLCRNR